MRLTKKREDGHYDDIDECVSTRCSDKLGKIEDIEEELGIETATLLKALKDGIYTRKNQLYPYLLHFNARQKYLYYIAIDDGGKRAVKYYCKDYGKTWALSKEELNK